jgi:DNA-binding NarL/FixJ family response regulator
VAKTRVLLADDHEEFRQGIRAALSGTYDIIADVADGEALVRAARQDPPDLIISDLSMPVLTGLQALSHLQAAGSTIDFIFLTVHSSPSYARKALKLGARGYVLKIYASEQLPFAIGEVLAGRTFVSPQIHL